MAPFGARMARRLDSDSVRRHVSGLLREYARQFQTLCRQVRRRIEDDPVHDLRVLTRRIRSALWVARRLAPAWEFGLLRRALRRLGSVLGRRRMLDVAAADAARYGLDVARLERHRAHEGAALIQQLGDVHRVAIVAALKEAARMVLRSTDDRLAGALEGRAHRLDAALRHSDRGKAALHELRIEAKQVRYLLEALGRKGDFLRELQRRIGRAHDLEVLQKRFKKRHEAVARDEAQERAAAERIKGRVVGRAVEVLTACVGALRGEEAAPPAKTSSSVQDPSDAHSPPPTDFEDSTNPAADPAAGESVS